MKIPNIDFKFWLENYPWNDGTVYADKNIRKFSDFTGSAKVCELEILRITSLEEPSPIEILSCIDLINQWGGRTSRLFYTRNQRNNHVSYRESIELNENLSIYKKGIALSKYKNHLAFKQFQKLNGIGPSFAGKHAMFWSQSELIVLDNKISGALGFSSPQHLLRSFPYDSILNQFNQIKTQNKFSNPAEVERALFAFHSNYFLNNNSGWKANIRIKTDEDVAKSIALRLGI